MNLTRQTFDLNGEWSLSYMQSAPEAPICTARELARSGAAPLKATVPGNFELDLCRNGVIQGDPFYGMNIAALCEYEYSYLWYSRIFTMTEVTAGNRAILVFEGLDCFAEVYVNGVLAGSTDNMLIEHRLDVTDVVRAGTNEILVAIRPAAIEAKKYDYPSTLVAMPQTYEGLHVRKAPHMYGWDIMPRAISAGIWRPVRIEIEPREHIKSAYLATCGIDPGAAHARLMLHFDMVTHGGYNDKYEVAIKGKCLDSSFSANRRLLFDAGNLLVDVAMPTLWQPAGRGEPSLYDVEVTLLKNSEVIDTAKLRHGIRTVELIRTSTTDASGSGEFVFKVNGERLFVKGSNWVPVDAYHSRDRERLPRIMPMLTDLGCNMVRCWGGNVYEDDYFFDYCDEHGILVWQDFAMACAVYPQDAEFQRRLSEEVQSVVRRLRQHACIALWAGDNECDGGWAHWWVNRDPNTNVLTRKVIPDVLRTEDPYRTYLPSSPYIDTVAIASGGRNLPEDHLWGPRTYYKMDFYSKSICHFASETGYHGSPSAESLARFISPERLWPYMDNPEWILHCTSPIPGVDVFDYRVELMATQIRNVFGVVPNNLEDFCCASQISQAEAFKYFIEMFRSQKWRRTGILWWNLMDGWPQLSDAVVDYYFDKKLAYHYIKRSQADVCLMVAETGVGGLELVAVNDTRIDLPLRFCVKNIDDSAIIASGFAVSKADNVTNLCPIQPTDTCSFYVIEWESDGHRRVNHFLTGKPPYDLKRYQNWLTLLSERQG